MRNKINILIFYILHLNIIKTLFVNFRLLSFKNALKFPILIFGRVDLSINGGKIIFKNKIRFQMLRIGLTDSNMWGFYVNNKTFFHLHGILECDRNVTISSGCKIYVKHTGHLLLGEDIFIGADTKIVCYKAIEIGEHSRISWECQIFDTDFHFVRKNNLVYDNTIPIKIGRNVWIGNRVSINKRTIISEGSIVASNSLVNKDFSSERNICIAGLPAKKIGTSVRRIFNVDIENRLYKYFLYHKDVSFISVENFKNEYS